MRAVATSLEHRSVCTRKNAGVVGVRKSGWLFDRPFLWIWSFFRDLVTYVRAEHQFSQQLLCVDLRSEQRQHVAERLQESGPGPPVGKSSRGADGVYRASEVLPKSKSVNAIGHDEQSDRHRSEQPV